MPELRPERIFVVIPAFNEGRVIREVVNSVLAHGYSVVVVDDCSRDDTSAVLRGSAVRSLRHPVNLGQGAALQTGIAFALGCQAEYIVTFDADGQHQAGEIRPMIDRLRQFGGDVLLGSRFLPGQAPIAMPVSRRLLLKAATAFTRLTTGLSLTDTHNGFRAFTAQAAGQLTITQNRMAHASQILSEIARLKLRYEEFPVTIQYTDYSLAKGQRAGNAFNILWESVTGRLFQ